MNEKEKQKILKFIEEETQCGIHPQGMGSFMIRFKKFMEEEI